MAIGARLKKHGDLSLRGELKERAPIIENGLVSHYSLDGGGGTFDKHGGCYGKENLAQNMNLVEALNLNWRDPASWSSNSGMTYDDSMDAMRIEGYHNSWLRTPMVIDNTKRYEISLDAMIEVRSTHSTGEGYLYLGGDSRDATGARATNNFDYTIASGDRPVIGQWKTYRLTRTGTATAPSGTSTSFDTVKGWTGDKGLAIKYYYLGGLFNYSGGGVMYIRNLSIRIVDAPTSNLVILNHDSIGLEKAATNQIPTSNMESYALGHTGNVCGFSNNFDARFGAGNWKTTVIPADNSPVPGLTKCQRIETFNTGSGGWTAGNIGTTTAPIIYGVWIRLWKGTIKWGDLNYNGITLNASNCPIGEWVYRAYHATGTAGGRHLYAIDHTKADILAVQIENHADSHSYVDGSRAESIQLTLPLEVKNTDFTIFGWHKFSSYVDGTQASNGRTAWVSGSHGFGLRFWNNASGQVHPWIDADSWGQPHNHAHLNVLYGLETWYPFVIIRSGTNLYWRIYKGTTPYQWAVSVTSTQTFDTLNLLNEVNTTYKDISIYNRALSDADILKMIGTPFHVKESGVKAVKLKENVNSLPVDAVWFPLSGDASPYDKTITPALVENIVYDKGTAWIGAGHTNLFANNTAGAFSVTSGKNYSVINFQNEEVVYENRFTGETWNYKGRDISVAAGTAYTASIEVYVSPDFNGTQSMMARVEQTGAVDFNYNMSKKGTWQSFKHTFTPSAAGTSRFLMYPCYNNATGTRGYVRYRNPQFTAKPFAPAFHASSLGYSQLNLTGSTVTGNSWQRFSEFFWINPQQSGVWRLTGAWSRFFFGINTTNKVTFSWMESGVQRSVSGPTNIPINEWTMIGCSVSNNSTIDLYVNGKRDLAWASTFQLNSTSMDFGLNSYAPNHTSYPLNAWVRDLVFVPRAVTAAEAEAMYSAQMRVKDGLRVQGSLSESQLLY